MNARWLTAAALAMAALCAAPVLWVTPAWAQAPAPVITQSLGTPGSAPEPRVVPIPLSKAHLIDLPEPSRDVIIADPEIADIIVKTPLQVYLVGRSVGATNVFFIGTEGSVIEHVLIRVEVDVLGAAAAIKELLPDARIDVKAVGDTIVLRGIVHSARESADAVAIAQRFVEAESSGGGGEEGGSGGGGGGEEGGGVINMLRILADQQVLLQVRVAEVQRNVVKNFSAVTHFNRRLLGSGPGTAQRGLSLTTSGVGGFDKGTEGEIAFNLLGFDFTQFSALERQGLVKTLAEPVLTVISGETANFLAGGEFPVPKGVDSNGNLLIEFQAFGVSLSFTPVVLAGKQISLRIKTEVSRKAEENKLLLTVGGSQIEAIGLTVNRAESTVVLPSGGNLMIAGLLQNDEFNTIEGVPWLKDTPILGALFRSPQFEQNQSELVILIQAFLVRPVPRAKRLSLPTDGFVSASDFDLFLLGRLYKRYSKKGAIDEFPSIRGPFGYIME